MKHDLGPCMYCGRVFGNRKHYCYAVNILVNGGKISCHDIIEEDSTSNAPTVDATSTLESDAAAKTQ